MIRFSFLLAISRCLRKIASRYLRWSIAVLNKALEYRQPEPIPNDWLEGFKIGREEE